MIAAAPDAPRSVLLSGGHMLGSIDWDTVSVLGELVSGRAWTYDELEWAEPHGETQLGRLPDSLTRALAAVLREEERPLALQWRGALDLSEDDVAREAQSIFDEARDAVARGGALWLRIEL
ncbi:MAG: hypothetical protein QM817_09175 [Archangium sp.]